MNNMKNIRSNVLSNQVNDKNLHLLLEAVNNPLVILNFKYFVTWIFMPTLCYQLDFPRTTKIRKYWLFKRCVEYFVSLFAFCFVFAQYSMPILNSSLELYKTKGLCIQIIGKILKLSVLL